MERKSGFALIPILIITLVIAAFGAGILTSNLKKKQLEPKTPVANLPTPSSPTPTPTPIVRPTQNPISKLSSMFPIPTPTIKTLPSNFPDVSAIKKQAEAVRQMGEDLRKWAEELRKNLDQQYSQYRQ